MHHVRLLYFGACRSSSVSHVSESGLLVRPCVTTTVTNHTCVLVPWSPFWALLSLVWFNKHRMLLF